MHKLFVFLFSVFLGLASAEAALQCAQAHSQRPKARSKLAKHIRQYRQSSIQETDIEVIDVNGVHYQVKGILGEGTSTVYLAATPEGRLVSIKLIEDDSRSHWVNSIYYEIAATKFYQEMGESVPKIIDHQVAYSAQLEGVIGLLVREYREGITREELEALVSEGISEWKAGKQLLKKLVAEQARLRKLHEGFRAWLTAKNIKLKPFPKLKSLIDEGDLSLTWSDNFLFDPELGRWIIFDP